MMLLNKQSETVSTCISNKYKEGIMKKMTKRLLATLLIMGILISGMIVYGDDEYPDPKPLTVTIPVIPVVVEE